MRILVVISFVFTALTSVGQLKSPFNNLEVANDSTNNYSFIVSGHFYGGSSNRTGYPVNTLLANLDWVNGQDHKMLICLGDLFMDVKNDIPKYQSSLFDKLEIPLFNAVGNHDLTGNIYEDNFGQTSFYLSINKDVHVFLDTEKDNGDIKNEQVELLKSVVDFTKFTEVNNVFIYSHRTVWKDCYDEMEGIFEDNTQSLAETNFEDEVLPLVNLMSKKSEVYWFSGSLGDAPASFFYHEDENLTIIATAIRGLPRDAMLEVSVTGGKVSFTPYSLTGEELHPLEEYNVDFWQSESGAEPFNWRLVPLYIKNIVFSRWFWYGVLSTIVFGWITVTVRRKIKNRIKPSN